MAQTTTLNLITAMAHSGPTQPQTTFIGESVEAASYYTASSNLQTFAWSFEQQFNATVLLEGTLETSPTESDWVIINEIDITEKSGFLNFAGNFVLLRARLVDWTAGSVHFVSVSY